MQTGIDKSRHENRRKTHMNSRLCLKRYHGPNIAMAKRNITR